MKFWRSGFRRGNSGFKPRDLFFQLLQTLFHLLELDGIEALLLCFRLGSLEGRVMVRLRRRVDGRMRPGQKREKDRARRRLSLLCARDSSDRSPGKTSTRPSPISKTRVASLSMKQRTSVGEMKMTVPVTLERVQQHVFGAKVEMVRWLIEQQKVRGMQQHAGKRVTVALTAGEHADGLEDIVF